MLRPNQNKTFPEKENADTYKTPQKTVLTRTPLVKTPKTPYRPLQDKTNKTPYVSRVLASGYKTPGGENKQLESELRSVINPKTTGRKRLSGTRSRHSSSKSCKKFDNIESGNSTVSECDDKLNFTIDNVPEVEYCPPRSPEPPFDVEEDLRVNLKSDILTLPLNADAFEFEDVELDIPIMPKTDEEGELRLGDKSTSTPGGMHGFAKYYEMLCDFEETIEQMLGGPKSFDKILEKYHKLDFPLGN
ncbi:3434_t:CDS:2 [Paraglomus occultum]|uniref:3434_t:CDS:1 n=1 Tax=Paraglomus occultum TaxID=144539 RepID=A0A9N8ZW70_9GLOM|nr:3434_t:CDS:2 [Paraglomus occultum]